MKRPTISGSAIVLDAPSGRDVQRAVAAFKKLFLTRPVVRVRGFFPRDAIRLEAGHADVRAALDLLNQLYEVAFVGQRWLAVDLAAPFGTVELDPALGRNVTVRLTLPEGGA